MTRAKPIGVGVRAVRRAVGVGIVAIVGGADTVRVLVDDAVTGETGEVDASGKVWTMIGEMTGPDGNPMKKRSVISLQDNDHHLMEMYFGCPDGSEAKGMEIRYERVSG